MLLYELMDWNSRRGIPQLVPNFDTLSFVEMYTKPFRVVCVKGCIVKKHTWLPKHEKAERKPRREIWPLTLPTPRGLKTPLYAFHMIISDSSLI